MATTYWLLEHMAPDFPTTLEELVARPEWQQWAACRGKGTDLFFTGKGGSYRAARELCDVCPVDRECRQFALDDEELDGFWARTTPNDRKALRRRARQSVA